VLFQHLTALFLQLQELVRLKACYSSLVLRHAFLLLDAVMNVETVMNPLNFKLEVDDVKYSVVSLSLEYSLD